MDPQTYEAGMSAINLLIAHCNKEIDERREAIVLNAFLMVVAVIFLVWFVVQYSAFGLWLCVAGVVVSGVLISVQTYHVRKALSLRTACCSVLMWAERIHVHDIDEQEWFRRSREATQRDRAR